jgi:hypothetical protein
MKLLIAYGFWNNQIDGFFILKYLKELKPMVFKIQRIPQQQYVGCAKFSIWVTWVKVSDEYLLCS